MDSDRKNKLLTVLATFRNEEDVLPQLVDRVFTVSKQLNLLNIDTELVLVDDCSSDNSFQILKDFALKHTNLKVIRMSKKFGVDECLVAGLKNSSGDAVIIMDADLQDPPEFMPKMLEKWLAGADVVFTVRISRPGETWVKLLVTRIGYIILNYFSPEIHIKNSGIFRLISRRALNYIVKFNEREPFVRGLISWVGFNQETLYYNRAPRQAGVEHFHPLKSINPIKQLIGGIVNFSDAPLYFVFLLGVLFFMVSSSILIYVLFKKFLGIETPDLSLILGFMGLMSGTCLLAVGIVAMYVVKIHQQIKSRPRYLIQDSLNFSTLTAD